MSADTFHKRVEGEMRKMKQVCDWNDFKLSMERSGKLYEMKVSDFQEHQCPFAGRGSKTNTSSSRRCIRCRIP